MEWMEVMLPDIFWLGGLFIAASWYYRKIYELARASRGRGQRAPALPIDADARYASNQCQDRE